MTNDPQTEHRNDQRMLAMMVEMTRFFHGDKKADQIARLAAAANTPEDWVAIRLAAEVHGDSQMFRAVAKLFRDCQTIDQAFAERDIHLLSARPFWGGMMEWIAQGARPTYLGRTDWALHFIFGGWIELTTGLGAEAGHLKEHLDRVFGLGQYDQGDIDATIAGAAAARTILP